MDPDRPPIKIVIETNFLTFPHGPSLVKMIMEGLNKFVREHDKLLTLVVAVEISLSYRRVPVQDKSSAVVNIRFIFNYDRWGCPREHSFSIILENDHKTVNIAKIHEAFSNSAVLDFAQTANMKL